METVGFAQIVNYFGQTLHTLAAGNETAVHGGYDTGDTEARAAGGNYLFVVVGVHIVHVDSFRSQARGRFGTLPHVVEVGALEPVEKFVIVSEGAFLVAGFLFQLFVRCFGTAGAGCKSERRESYK